MLNAEKDHAHRALLTSQNTQHRVIKGTFVNDITQLGGRGITKAVKLSRKVLVTQLFYSVTQGGGG